MWISFGCLPPHKIASFDWVFSWLSKVLAQECLWFERTCTFCQETAKKDAVETLDGRGNLDCISLGVNQTLLPCAVIARKWIWCNQGSYEKVTRLCRSASCSNSIYTGLDKRQIVTKASACHTINDFCPWPASDGTWRNNWQTGTIMTISYCCLLRDERVGRLVFRVVVVIR